MINPLQITAKKIGKHPVFAEAHKLIGEKLYVPNLNFPPSVEIHTVAGVEMFGKGRHHIVDIYSFEKTGICAYMTEHDHATPCFLTEHEAKSYIAQQFTGAVANLYGKGEDS